MKWAPVPWKSSDFAPRGISFPEKLCYTTDITVKFLPFCQFGFVSTIPAPPQTSLRRKPSPKALPYKTLGGQDHYLHFPVRGRKHHAALTICIAKPYHYLHFPVRGRKLLLIIPFVLLICLSLFTFPRKGTETLANFILVVHCLYHHYLHFPARGRKLDSIPAAVLHLFPIITYISP